MFYTCNNIFIHIYFRLIDTLLPEGKKIDFSKKTFQHTTNPAFAMARERERIGIFLQKAGEFGVPNTNLFQTDYLYERTNLVQVCTCIRAIGIEASRHERLYSLKPLRHIAKICDTCSPLGFSNCL